MEQRIETTVKEKGEISIKGLPFQTGEVVEVIIREQKRRKKRKNPYPLRGTPLRYDDPFGSVAEEEWAALK